MSTTQLTAFAFRSGHIGFVTSGVPLPAGALYIARGPEHIVGPLVRGNARLAYDNETYLVPGCPEAEDDEQAYQAFIKFFERIQESLQKRMGIPAWKR